MAKRRILKWLIGLLACFIILATCSFLGFQSYATPTIRENVGSPIYTIGDPGYAKAIENGKNIVKFGPLPFGFYTGGIAFENQQDADLYITGNKKNDGWGVYRLSGDFEIDTYEYEGQTYINKSLLVLELMAPDVNR